MKLNNLQKNFFIFFSVIISILVATLIWEKIALPLNNTTGAKGILVSEGYNPNNDTIRYIFFIALPLMVYLFLNQTLKNRTIRVGELIFEKDEKVTNYYPVLIRLSFIFIIFIFLEFFSVNYSYSEHFMDHTHDGNYLTPTQNYWLTKNFWTSTYLIHGISDMFYPLLTWKILGVKSIGVTRTFPIFVILVLKLLCVLLSYQLTKISKLNTDTKILFFTIFTSILLSMSHYTFLGAGYYFSHKDIYIILFLIFFIELFVHSKLRSLFIILICLIATVSILLQIDRGAYIYFVLFFYFLYSLIAKKYNDALLIFFSLIICWIIVINLIGFDEFQAYLENTKTMAISGEWTHGLKYPEPFFSIGDDPNGARATRALLLQLTAGLFVLNYLISNKNKIFSSKKVLFIFLFLLSLIIYKNALGRSDSAHIRGSHDLPVLINDVKSSRLPLAKKMGGLPIDLSKHTLEEGMEEHGIKDLDVAIDATGKTIARKNALNALAKRGVLVMVGNGEGLDFEQYPDMGGPERSILGSEYFSYNEMETNHELLKYNQEYLSQIITHQYKIQEVQTAYEHFFSPDSDAGKIAVVHS